MLKTKEPVFSRSVFDERISRTLAEHKPSHYYYTYIAESSDGLVYKFGFSKNPIKRETTFGGGYRQFGFKMRYFLEGSIETDLLCALMFSGAEYALPVYPKSKRREAFYMKKEDVEYIADKCGFRPISEFNEDEFRKLHDEETKEFVAKYTNI